MQPVFEISAEGRDLSTLINRRLIELSITDEQSDQSDLVMLQLALDPADKHQLKAGDTLQISLGFLDADGQRTLANKGRFTIDSVAIVGPPDQLSVKARAADIRQSMKVRKNRHFDDIRLGDLVTTIAQEHGLRPNIAAELTDQHYPYLAQVNESDLNLLSRLGRELDAVARPKNGQLLVVPKGQARAASGQNLTPIKVSKTHCEQYKLGQIGRSLYGSVLAFYTNPENGLPVYSIAGEGNPSYLIPDALEDQVSAQRAANAKWRTLKRETGTGNLTLNPGIPTIAAESPLDLSDWGTNTGWIATRVVHRLNRRGLTTSVEMETTA